MDHEARNSETRTVEALVSAFEQGAVSRREFLRRASLLGLTVAGAGALADAAAPARARAQTTQKREFVFAQGGDISKFDPHYSTGQNDIRISFNTFDNLVSRHPDDKLYPALATEWKATAPTTWEFKLRQGVKFHNGDPFTSADVKFSIERTYDPTAKTLVATVFPLARVEAPDPYTVVFHTKQPDALLPARLAFYGGPDHPEEVRGAGRARTRSTRSPSAPGRSGWSRGPRTTRRSSTRTRTTGAARSTSTGSSCAPSRRLRRGWPHFSRASWTPSWV